MLWGTASYNYSLSSPHRLSESVGSLHRIKGPVLYGVFAVWPGDGVHRALPECLLHPGHVHLVWRDVQHPVHGTLYPHCCVSPWGAGAWSDLSAEWRLEPPGKAGVGGTWESVEQSWKIRVLETASLQWPGQGMTTFPAHPLLLTLKPSALGSSETGTITPICQIGKGRVGNAEKPAHNHTETKQRKLWAYDTCHAPEAISGCHSKGPGPQPLQRSGAISGSYWLSNIFLGNGVLVSHTLCAGRKAGGSWLTL